MRSPSSMSAAARRPIQRFSLPLRPESVLEMAQPIAVDGAHGPAVDALQRTLALQGGEVAADGDVRHGQLMREVGDSDAASLEQQSRDLRAPLPCARRPGHRSLVSSIGRA